MTHRVSTASAPIERETRQKTNRSRALCPHCEATPGGCLSLHTIGGRRCCEACDGDHDHITKRK